MLEVFDRGRQERSYPVGMSRFWWFRNFDRGSSRILWLLCAAQAVPVLRYTNPFRTAAPL